MPDEHVLKTLENQLSFLINELINEPSVSKTAHPPLKTWHLSKIGMKVHINVDVEPLSFQRKLFTKIIAHPTVMIQLFQ